MPGIPFPLKTGSTGVDPVARREIWQMVSDIVSTEVEGVPKTSVILTTHSMDECEVSPKASLSTPLRTESSPVFGTNILLSPPNDINMGLC